MNINTAFQLIKAAAFSGNEGAVRLAAQITNSALAQSANLFGITVTAIRKLI